MEKFWREMDKFFSANKLFVAFCAALIVIWIALQFVVYMRVIEIAKLDAVRIFSWSWPVKERSILLSSSVSQSAQVLKKNSLEVMVKVNVRQSFEKRSLATAGASALVPGADIHGLAPKRTLDCEATLTYYRSDNRWILGKVELK